MNNTVHGKMENLKNKINVKHINKKTNYLKWTSKPSHISHKIFENYLVAIFKVILTPNKPAYVGMCILDLSKLSMYEFHYDYIKNKYGNNWKLLFTDTDSFMYEIKTKDAYQDFSKNKEMFDFSYYSTD